MSALLALAAAGLNVGGQIAQNVFNRHQIRENNRLELQMFRENLDWQERMMDKQNEYNLPQNQMARLKEAGLNPNLVYEQGGSFTPSANVGSVSTPHTEAPQMDLSGLGNDLLRGLTAAYELDNIKAQTDAIKAKARMDNANAYYLERYGYGGTMDENGKIYGSLRDMISEQEWSNLKVQKAITDYQQQHPDLIARMAQLPATQQRELSNKAAQIAALTNLDQVRKEIEEINRDWAKQNVASGLDPHAPASVKLMNDIFKNWHKMDFGDKFQSVLLMLMSALQGRM